MPCPSRRPFRRLGVALAAVALGLAACGVSSNDDSGAARPGALECSSASAASGGCPVNGSSAQTSQGTVHSASAPGACTTRGSGRTDDFHQQVTLGPPSADGLQVGDITVGGGPVPTTGQLLTVQYTGWLSDGTSFDSSRKQGAQPFQFALGQGSVIKGWDEGVATMHVGGVRRLRIPPALGYGAAGSPPVIPANATLTFDVELVCAG